MKSLNLAAVLLAASLGSHIMADEAAPAHSDALLSAIMEASATLVPGDTLAIPVEGSDEPVMVTMNADGSISVAGVDGIAAVVVVRDANGAPTAIAIDANGDGTVDVVRIASAAGPGPAMSPEAAAEVGVPSTVQVTPPASPGEQALGGGDAALGNLGNAPSTPVTIPAAPSGGFGGGVGENNTVNPSPTL